MSEQKTLNNVNVEEVKKNVSDVEVFGDGDTFKLLCKASSKKQGWMKSTKVCTIPQEGCIVQTSTQQGDHVAEALVYIPNVKVVEVGGVSKLVSMFTSRGSNES